MIESGDNNNSNNNRDVQREAPPGKDTQQLDGSKFQVGKDDMQTLRGNGSPGNEALHSSLGDFQLSGVTQPGDTSFKPQGKLNDAQQPGVSDAMKPYDVADASNKLPQSDSRPPAKDAPPGANEMNEKLGIKDANGQIPKTAEYIKDNMESALTNPEASMKVQAAFASAADAFRHENPNATAGSFANAMNNELKDPNVLHPTANVAADSDGNLTLSRFESPMAQRRGDGDKGVPVAEANIGDPTTGTQRADNLAQTFTPGHQGKLAADAVFAAGQEPKFGVPNQALAEKHTGSNEPSTVFNTAVDNLNNYTKGQGPAEPFFDAFNRRMGEVGGQFSAEEVNRGEGTGGLRAELHSGKSVTSGSYRDTDVPLNRR